jgi:hypothetical protein
LSYREIADELTNRNIPTPRGGDVWNAMTVMRVMKRLGITGKRRKGRRTVNGSIGTLPPTHWGRQKLLIWDPLLL